MSASPESELRPFSALGEEDRARIDRARQKAFILYEGKRVAHRSCGIALAETFGLPTAPYQALRKGGITGEGECGAIKAGELILGELLGDPDPTAPVTANLREAAALYRAMWSARVDRGEGGSSAPTSSKPTMPERIDIRCNSLTGPFEEFLGAERQRFCTNIAAEVAAIVAEILARLGVERRIEPIPELASDDRREGPEND